MARRGSFTSCEAFIIPIHSFSFCIKCVTDPVVVYVVVVESVKLNYLQSLVLVCTLLYGMRSNSLAIHFVWKPSFVPLVWKPKFSYCLFGDQNLPSGSIYISAA